MTDDARAATASLLRRTMRRDRLPGVSVAVVDRDGIRYADGFGSRDLAGNRPATPETLYGIGSVTKSVTALALAQLQEAGMVAFDDPVRDYLDVDLGDDSDDPIRLHHLLSHSSGLPSLGTSEALIGRRLRRDTDTLPLASTADFRAHIEDAVGGGDRGESAVGGGDRDGGVVGGDAAARREVVGSPGERFAYANAGYVLLGDVVEAVTGRPYDRYVAEHVLDPLGMERTTFDDMEFSMDDDHATVYLQEDGDLVAASLPTRELSRPAGGLLASVSDLARYVRLFLDGGTVDGRTVVSGEAVDTLTEGRIDTPSGPYGYGWRTRECCGYDLVGHSGSIAVSSAYVGFAPETGLGVVVAANASPGYPLVRLGEGVFACAVGADPQGAVPFFERRRRFDRLTGEYTAYRGVKRGYVARDGGTLRLELAGPLGGESLPLTESETDPYTFHTPNDAGESVPVEFRVQDHEVNLLYDRWHLHKVADEVVAPE
ncbi:serine hydrolase [Halobaculum limi]|uniref:serine hydrolase n=1 Tax=Halobaculum limi TaxID=3031916 RepID=UPI0024069493|nr:serine hydrolase [Halobaculum sp. YSMS11]